MYFFGVREPGCYGIVNVTSRRSTLFVPRLPAEYATWMGKLLTVDNVREQYGVDEVRYVDEVSTFEPVFFHTKTQINCYLVF